MAAVDACRIDQALGDRVSESQDAYRRGVGTFSRETNVWPTDAQSRMRELRPVVASEDTAGVGRRALPENMLDVAAFGPVKHMLLPRRLEWSRIAGGSSGVRVGGPVVAAGANFTGVANEMDDA